MKPNTLTRREALALAAGLLAGAASARPAIPFDPTPAVEANSDFALAIYRRLAGAADGENVFFSPYSISSALLMAAEGARGQTALEMGEVLGLPEAARRGDGRRPWEFGGQHIAMGKMNKGFNRSGKKYELAVANALWGERTFPFDDAYVSRISSSYGTDALRPADFARRPEAERKLINAWVEEVTRDRIKDLLPDGSIDALTRLVLVNAIYFKGDWKVPFEERSTRDGEFLLPGGRSATTKLMHARKLKVARYAAFNADGSTFDTPASIDQTKPQPELYPGADGFSMVELPYSGDELSMLVIAPNSAEGLGAIESKLGRQTLGAWIASLERRDTHVTLPKFKSETSYELNGVLSAMGMPTAFDMAKADFNGVAKSGTDAGLSISGVYHKAFVEVGEEGTEAAAATGVVLAARASVAVREPFVPEFRADRPFLYLIRDNASGSILFMGRMTKP